MNIEHRLNLVENKLVVALRELKETQELSETLAKTLTIALQTITIRLELLEKAIPKQGVRTDEIGRDL